MKLNRKIKAFTLSEMIVVIIITAIVAGLAFSVLVLVNKQMSFIQSNFEKSSEINRLEMALHIDFNMYSRIKFSSQDNTLKLKSAVDSISYTFDRNKVIRAKDTFNIPIKEKWFYFNGEQIDNGQIDAIKMKTSKETQNQPLFIFKQNDATQFMMDK